MNLRNLIIIAVTLTVGPSAQAAETCSPTSRPSGSSGALSDAAFWKGVDGAQFITELDDNSHEQFIQDNPTAFVMYYATWCGYSKQARKGYGGAAKKMNGKVKFGAVDCDKASEVCQGGEHAVQGYPTFYLYKSGSWSDEYASERTTQAFVKYLQKKQ